MSSRSSELPHEQESATPARARVFERLERLVRAVGQRVAYGVTALLLVALCVAAARYYAAVKSELTEVAMARRAAVAQLAAATLSERLDRMLDVGVALATRVRFAELVAAGQWDAAIQIMKSVPADFRFVERVALFDARGTAMAASPSPACAARTLPAATGTRASAGNGSHTCPGIYRRSTPPQRAVFAVAVPVMDRGGAPAGILQMQVQLEHFFDWAQGIDPGAGGVVYVVDGKGAAAFDSRRAVQTEVDGSFLAPRGGPPAGRRERRRDAGAPDGQARVRVRLHAGAARLGRGGRAAGGAGVRRARCAAELRAVRLRG